MAFPAEAADPANLQVTRGNTTPAEDQALHTYSSINIYENAHNETFDDDAYAMSTTLWENINTLVGLTTVSLWVNIIVQAKSDIGYVIWK